MIAKIVVNALALYIVTAILPGFRIVGWQSLLIASLVWAVMTTLVRPVLVLLTLPINLMSLGLFTFVLNGLLLFVTAKIVPGFVIADLGAAVVGWIILSVVSSILNGMK